jgi:hypothetical protein
MLGTQFKALSVLLGGNDMLEEQEKKSTQSEKPASEATEPTSGAEAMASDAESELRAEELGKAVGGVSGGWNRVRN